MKNCSAYQTQFEETYTPTLDLTPPRSKRGIVSAVIRLLAMTGCNVAAVIALVYAPFQNADMTLWEKIWDGFASFAMLLFLGAWLWGAIKWAVLAFPKTFRGAKRILETIIPLSVNAAIVEFSICGLIALIPYGAYLASFVPIMWLMDFISAHRGNILIPLLLLVASAPAVYFLGRWDFRKVFGNKFGAKKSAAQK